MKNFIDSKLIKYPWYRKWQAKRSRKRLEKKDRFVENDGIESYTPCDIILKQDASDKEKAELRKQREIENAVALGDEVWSALETESGKLYISMSDREQEAFWIEYQKRKYV